MRTNSGGQVVTGWLTWRLYPRPVALTSGILPGGVAVSPGMERGMAGGGLERKAELQAGKSRADDYLSRVREIAPALAAAAEEVDARRELPEAIITALVEAGLFRLL